MMPRDYAKKPRSRKAYKTKKRTPASKSAKQNAKPGSLWLITGILCGLFVAGLFYLHGRTQQQATSTPLKAVVKNKTTAVKKLTKVVKTKQIPEPKFDFYTILPQQKVNLPPKAPAKQIVSNAQYILQIAAVTTPQDADRLKAQLTLLGYNVLVQEAKKDQRIWYRVSVGPYRDKHQAEDDQSRLRQNKIDSLLVQLNKTA